MYIDVSGKNSYLETLIKQNNELSLSYPQDMSRTSIKYKEQKPKNTLSYYDSPVVNSCLYPAFKYIPPYELNYLAVSNGKLQKEAFNNETFVIGGQVLTRSQLPAPKTRVF